MMELNAPLAASHRIYVTVHGNRLYDTKKKYCPKYEFAFYLTIPAMQSFFAVYMPMLLVTIYAAVNVLNDAESASQLDNAVAIATVIVFVLPQLNTESKGQDTFGP